MASYKVKWYDPARRYPLVKWFTGEDTKRRADEFRARLPFLSSISSSRDAR